MESQSDFLTLDMSRRDASDHDTSQHSLTIKQAARLFAELGVPRSPRSIQRFCELNNIDCIRVKGEKTERYFINQPSVERYAQELKQLENISRLEDDTSRHDAPQRVMTRSDATLDEAPVKAPPIIQQDHEASALRERVADLEKEKFHLLVDRAAKEQIISQMLDERPVWLEQLTKQSREIGRLEMQIQQLAAPERDMSRHDATEIAERTILPTPVPPEVVTVIEPALPKHAPLAAENPKRSFWGKLFG